MWVTKLLISQVKKRIFCPKLAFLVNFGQAMQAYSVPCWWVGLWLWRAGCISQDTYLLYQILFLCGLNSDLCHLGGSKNLGPRNWRFSSTVHVFTLPTQKSEELLFRLVFYHLSNGLHDVFLLVSRYIPVLKIWDRNKKKTRI